MPEVTEKEKPTPRAGRREQGQVGVHRLSGDATPRDALGRPLRDLRISVTDRCNFRCPYCMPAEIYGERYEFLPRPELLTFEEIERLARLFVELGVEKLRITGGEPLLRAELPSLLARLAALPGVPDLTLTTNGVLLPRARPPPRGRRAAARHREPRQPRRRGVPRA